MYFIFVILCTYRRFGEAERADTKVGEEKGVVSATLFFCAIKKARSRKTHNKSPATVYEIVELPFNMSPHLTHH